MFQKILSRFSNSNKKIIKYIPYGRQNITRSDVRAVKNILKNKNLTQGEQVPLFESEINRTVDSKYSVAVNSGTSALHIACLALNLQVEDYLWTSPISFVASANCGLYCRAKIDFVDINISTGLIDIDKLKDKLENSKKIGQLPKILVCVHLAGTSCEMKSIHNLSIEYGFKIIEDASHALGGFYNQMPVGNCKYSDITVFSFHPVKIITTAEGGVATTNNIEIFEKMKLLRSHYIEKNKKKFLSDDYGLWTYEQQGLGFNYRMNDIQAALGISQLKRLSKIVKKRNQILNFYKKNLNLDEISFLEIPENIQSSVHLVVILFKKIPKESYKKIFTKLRSLNIGVQLHYFPIHLQPYFKNLGFKEGDFPSSEEYSKRAISIPVFENLKINEMKYVLKQLNNICDEFY